MNRKRALVNLYKDTHFLYGIVYQHQHKSRFKSMPFWRIDLKINKKFQKVLQKIVLIK